MKNKADTKDGFFLVADDLAQALVRSNFTAAQYSICLWMLCCTYGRKSREGKGSKEVHAHKDVEVRYSSISHQIGIDRTNVRRSFVKLIKEKVFRVTSKGRVGFNTKINEWPTLRGSEIPMGIGPKTWASQPMGQDAHGRPSPILEAPVHQRVGLGRPVSEAATPQNTMHENVVRARDTLGDVGEMERGDGPPGHLPNGKRDTMMNRADLGHIDYPPNEHRDWPKENYARRDRYQDEWEADLAMKELHRISAEKIAHLKEIGAIE